MITDATKSKFNSYPNSVVRIKKNFNFVYELMSLYPHLR